MGTLPNVPGGVETVARTFVVCVGEGNWERLKGGRIYPERLFRLMFYMDRNVFKVGKCLMWVKRDLYIFF